MEASSANVCCGMDVSLYYTTAIIESPFGLAFSELHRPDLFQFISSLSVGHPLPLTGYGLIENVISELFT